jgi:hypothetical protein
MNPVIALMGLFWLITSMTGVAACVSLVRALRLTLHGVVTDGRVVAHEEDSESTSVTAVIEYVVAGVRYRVSTNTYLHPTKSPPVGAARQVTYMPDHPRRAEVVGLNRYVPVISLSVITLAVGALAGGLTYLEFFP